VSFFRQGKKDSRQRREPGQRRRTVQQIAAPDGNWSGLKKSPTAAPDARGIGESWSITTNEEITISRQCELLGLTRSRLYYKPIPVA